MSTSYDKVVKLACKPKAAPPKPKVCPLPMQGPACILTSVMRSTWTLSLLLPGLKMVRSTMYAKLCLPASGSPMQLYGCLCTPVGHHSSHLLSQVVFKALIVLHTMIRNGATDNVLAYLSSSDVLRLKNISAGVQWEGTLSFSYTLIFQLSVIPQGYAAPQNLQNYAVYLDTRIKAYRDLKHDAIRVQSESNRDLRNSAAIEEDKQAEHHEKRRFGRRRGRETEESSYAASGPQRSKTIAGRKLRVMTVEKGLLRETKVVQKMIDSLVECRVRAFVCTVMHPSRPCSSTWTIWRTS